MDEIISSLEVLASAACAVFSFSLLDHSISRIREAGEEDGKEGGMPRRADVAGGHGCQV